jgi:CDP-glycerol glycerophosphotransferase (TagB/SpsB family)
MEFPYAFQLYEEGEYDFLLALHPTERELAIETFGPGVSGRIRVVGQPKLDRLANAPIDAGPVHRSLDLPPGRKTVLVTSHWTPTSLLCTCGEVILEQLRNRRDLNVVVTGHHHLWGFPSPWARTVDWRARLAWVGQEPHMRLLPRVPDLHALMAAADVMVSDHSSATAEYAILGRPLVVFRNPAHRFHGAEFERLLAETTEVFHGAEDFLPALGRALDQPVPASGPRDRFLSATFAFLGSSTEQAAEAVEALALTGRL